MKRRTDDAPLLWLVHPGAGESTRADELSALGYRVVGGPWNSPTIIRKKAEPPCAVVIDLSRSPSTGRDIAVAMRSHSVLIPIPFILVEGAEDKLASITKLLPDAIATTWPRIGATLTKASAKPPSGGKKLSVFAAYEGKSLVEKLGIKALTTVATVNAPSGFRATLGNLPEGAKIHGGTSSRDLTLWFVRTADELRDRIGAMKPHATSGRLWINWRKGDASLNQLSVRKAAMDVGLVDFRITRIDAEWSGLRFTIRK
jgi:hypothetical protein